MRSSVAVLIAAVCFAGRSTGDDSRPAPSNVRNAEYPRIHEDQRVTFRIRAGEARAVQLRPGGDENGLGGPLDMERDDDGTWTVTTAPVTPGFHYYWFLIDGVAVNDPGSETFFGWGRQTSGIDVPEPGAEFCDLQDVPHGAVQAHWYFSNTTGQWRRAFVYTPPTYDADPSTRFPVLYLQHGAGEDERGWSTQGRVQFIMDNLLASRGAKPMLVVMDCGYARRAGEADGENAFADVLLTDLIPEIDAGFRTLTDRNHRAMAGLSMGGMQTLSIALTHPERFAYVGAFSAPARDFELATSYGGVFADPDGYHERVRLLWLGTGTGETRIHASVEAMHEQLAKAGISHEFTEYPGLAHEWQTWRKSLRDFAPLLFRTD